MANVLDSLIPDLYAGIDKVSRELAGFSVAAGRNLSSVPAAKGEDIVIPVSSAAVSQDFTPSMGQSEPDAVTVTNVKVAITKSKIVQFGITGEEQRGLDNGPGGMTVQADMIAQAVRKLVNEIEEDLAVEAVAGGSRAFGTAGTTPFASNLKDAAQILKVLKDNGAPNGELQLVTDTTTGVNIRSLTQLTNVNEAGEGSLLRQGLITAAPIFGLNIRETGASVSHTAGTGANYVSSGALTAGTTLIPLVTGTGTVVTSDFVTFAGDSNKYMVKVGVAAPGTIEIAAPGLRADLADATAMTVGADYDANVAFDKAALQLVARPPLKPKEGDLRIDSTIITDPHSGLSFEVSVWPGVGMVKYTIGLSWGVKAIKNEHIAVLLSQ